MTRYEYDEEASAAWRMDVVHEVDDSTAPVSRWVEAMRRLNTINDPLARKLLTLHRDCGSGTGVCDSAGDGALLAGTRHRPAVLEVQRHRPAQYDGRRGAALGRPTIRRD